MIQVWLKVSDSRLSGHFFRRTTPRESNRVIIIKKVKVLDVEYIDVYHKSYIYKKNSLEAL